MKITINKSLIIHPFLFGLFPVLFLFAHNMDEVSARPDHSTALGLVLFDMEQRISRRDDVLDNPLTRLCSKFLRKIHAVM